MIFQKKVKMYKKDHKNLFIKDVENTQHLTYTVGALDRWSRVETVTVFLVTVRSDSRTVTGLRSSSIKENVTICGHAGEQL